MRVRACGVEVMLQHKALQLMEDPEFGIDFYWLDIRELYGQRRKRTVRERPAKILGDITEIFWRLCAESETLNEPSMKMSYLKARLLPHVRPEGSRSVFQDGRISVFERKHPKGIQALDHLLVQAETMGLDVFSFCSQTAELLGNLKLTKDEGRFIERVESDLFSEAMQLLLKDREQAFRSLLKNWRSLNQRWGTRSSAREKKLALNVLSYECKADFHRCYSAAWVEILKVLYQKRKIDEPSYRWMSLWHTDVQGPLCGGPEVLHLFHGHVFALHPGAALLLLTASGKKIAAEWLMDLDNEHKFYRLLHALMVCMSQYLDEHETYKAGRRRRPIIVEQVEGVEAMNVARKRGERRPKARESDAR